MNDPKQVAEVVAAVDQMADGIRRLKAIGVIRSRKAFADLAEWLIAQLFNGTLAPSKNQPGWDVRADGDRIQVRSHSKASDNPNRWSIVKPGDFDSLVVVVFNESFRVSELYRIPAAALPSVMISTRVRWDDLKPQQLFPGVLEVPPLLRDLFVVNHES